MLMEYLNLRFHAKFKKSPYKSFTAGLFPPRLYFGMLFSQASNAKHVFLPSLVGDIIYSLRLFHRSLRTDCRRSSAQWSEYAKFCLYIIEFDRSRVRETQQTSPLSLHSVIIMPSHIPQNYNIRHHCPLAVCNNDVLIIIIIITV